MVPAFSNLGFVPDNGGAHPDSSGSRNASSEWQRLPTPGLHQPIPALYPRLELGAASLETLLWNQGSNSSKESNRLHPPPSEQSRFPRTQASPQLAHGRSVEVLVDDTSDGWGSTDSLHPSSQRFRLPRVRLHPPAKIVNSTSYPAPQQPSAPPLSNGSSSTTPDLSRARLAAIPTAYSNSNFQSGSWPYRKPVQ